MLQAGQEFRFLLETLSDQSMPGFERKHVGGWVLRASLGATSRANTVWPGAAPGGDLLAAIDEAESWYQSRDLRCGFQLFEGHDPALAGVLRARSYVEVAGAQVMWAPVDEIVLPSVDLANSRLKVTSQIDPQLALLIDDPGRVREITMSDPELSHPALSHPELSHPVPRFAAVTGSSGEVLGGGKSVLIDDALGVFAMFTAHRARRRGIASAVLSCLISHGQADGAKWVWLQVAGDNEAAISLYERAGFRVAHSYEYLFETQ